MLVTFPFLFLLLDYWPLKRLLSPKIIPQQPAGKTPTGRHRPDKQVTMPTGNPSNPSSQSLPHVASVEPSRQPRSSADTTGSLNLFIEKTPMLLLVVASSVMTYYAQSTGGALAPLTWDHRLKNAVVTYVCYIGKTIWPQNLAVLYPNLPNLWNDWQVIGSFAPLIGCSALVIRKRQQRYLTVGWCWYLGTLVPVIGIIHVGQQSMADRYMYLPLTGLTIILTWGLADLVQYRNSFRKLGITFGIVIVVSCGWLTYRQVHLWQNSETLFRHALAVTQSNYVLHNNLGVVLQSSGRISEAITHYQHAVRYSHTGYADAHYNLARAFQGQQEYEAAIKHYRTAIQLRPHDANTHNNLAGVYHSLQNFNEAVHHYRRAVDLDRQHVEAWYNLAGTMRDQKHWQDSIRCYRHVVEKLKPGHVGAHNNLGVLLHMQGDLDLAIHHYRQALTSDKHNLNAHLNLAVALKTSGNLKQALDHIKTVLTLNPGHRKANEMFLRWKHSNPAAQSTDLNF